jgi:hypothetical protein
VALRILNDANRMNPKDPDYPLLKLKQYTTPVYMGPLGDSPMTMDRELGLLWVLYSADGKQRSEVPVKCRVLPPNRGIPSRNILLSAELLEKLGHRPLTNGHFFQKLDILTPRYEQVRNTTETANLFEPRSLP